MIQGRFQPVLAAGQYNPVLAKLARFGANRSQVGTNPLKKKKKKKTLKRDTDARATASLARRRVGPRRTQVGHLFCCIRAS